VDPKERTVFLIDVDNTLLDNDRAQNDYLAHIRRHMGDHAAERYWAIFQDLTKELGYADYLGALQRYRREAFHDPHLLLMSSYLLDYPFRERIYPGAFDVLHRLGLWGQTVVFSDGDVVFQPHKIEHSGIRAAVFGRVLIYIHKEEELADVERFYPAEHYVLIDDKRRILAAVKKQWGARVTTVQPIQGHWALDEQQQAAYPEADITIRHIGELMDFDLTKLRNQ
jgi:FMN phosphatase YigB (HAD superfamily)